MLSNKLKLFYSVKATLIFLIEIEIFILEI